MRTVVALFLAFVFSLGSWAAEPSVLITPRGYYLLLLDADGAPRIVPAHVIDLRGDQPLPPTPVPPQPNPPQPPVPPQPVAGPRWIAILHESAQATPEWARLVVRAPQGGLGGGQVSGREGSRTPDTRSRPADGEGVARGGEASQPATRTAGADRGRPAPRTRLGRALRRLFGRE
ncbi:MAG: hypothetical protein KatS3mg038_3847 [Candidatus Kapaibacterium sp.]|nr:MAG: hypothetical protein KatS3mg038_3847 [Candidatus Kapabacteria bacterium]